MWDSDNAGAAEGVEGLSKGMESEWATASVLLQSLVGRDDKVAETMGMAMKLFALRFDRTTEEHKKEVNALQVKEVQRIAEALTALGQMVNDAETKMEKMERASEMKERQMLGRVDTHRADPYNHRQEVASLQAKVDSLEDQLQLKVEKQRIEFADFRTACYNAMFFRDDCTTINGRETYWTSSKEHFIYWTHTSGLSWMIASKTGIEEKIAAIRSGKERYGIVRKADASLLSLEGWEEWNGEEWEPAAPRIIFSSLTDLPAKAG
eukprot:NODE_4256_length_1914_cov_1.533856.p1 GENE.NODE_4256_length_1914_cov_1.533856~~NODE_4256_length_1914_cov_1.533856.p1  ORF type:complete len:265 (-),score=83.60 NODE_4256_length_1914_cov_1.533856:1075-1869(-)